VCADVGGRGSIFVVLVAVGTLALGLSAVAGAARAEPVPSLQPQATAKLWRKLVQPRRVVAGAAGCTPLRLVFYTPTDWLRIATKMAANQASCGQYYISIPPLAADKTNFRPDQPWRIRALGSNFHAMCEISYNGWSSWVNTTGASWYEAGVEARRRMAAQGFDVSAGDVWAVNESSSAVRTGAGNARRNLRDLVRGLYDAAGEGPAVKGAVYVIGAAGQGNTSLSLYKGTLEMWLGDGAFWSDMQTYVSDWAQEAYGDFRNYAVAGASLEARGEELNAWLQHPLRLANSGPDDVATARTFLQSAYSPLANAAWRYTQAFGWTDVPFDQMQDYVSAQTYAARSAGTHFGFAWTPKRPDTETITQFSIESGAVADRLAAAIHDSAEAPTAACGAEWCTSAVDGAWFNESWRDFASWSTQTFAFGSAPVSSLAGTVSGPLTVSLQLAGVIRADVKPVTVTLSSSSAGAAFATAPDGSWSSTLAVDIPTGSTDATFYYRDTLAGTPTITASAPGRTTTQQLETVLPGSLASLRLSPQYAGVTSGGTQQFTATGADAFGNPLTPAPAWSVSDGTPGTISASGLFTASATTGGSGAVIATVEGVSSSAPVVVGDPEMRPQTITFAEIAAKAYGDPDFGVDATVSSGLPVVLSASGNCAVDGTRVHVSGAGSCTITATQVGDATHSAAPGVARTFAIAKADQTIEFEPLSDKLAGDADFSVHAAASSGLSVAFDAAGACSAIGDAIHITASGSCTVTASQAGNANYNAASDVSRSFAIRGAAQASTATRCVVPKLTGKRLAMAKRLLAKRHCRLGTTRRAPSRPAKKGIVLSQSRRPGSVLAANAKIAVVIGGGIRPHS
jgi:hypothetical protein